MHKTQGDPTPQTDLEHASIAKIRDARQRPASKPKLDDIHPSLRALPDYPE